MIYINVLGLILLLRSTLGFNPDDYIKYCSEQSQCGTGETCKAVAGSPYGQCLPHFGSVSYCVEDDQCRNEEKCAASGNPAYGQCKPELDPTGKYCAGSRDCRWYLLEKCVNGECQKVID